MAITYAKNDLTIHYSGSYTYSYDINPAHITGDVEIDVQNEEIKKLQAGAFITINQQGYAELADGATAVHAKAIRQAKLQLLAHQRLSKLSKLKKTILNQVMHYTLVQVQIKVFLRKLKALVLY